MLTKKSNISNRERYQYEAFCNSACRTSITTPRGCVGILLITFGIDNDENAAYQNQFPRLQGEQRHR